MDYLNKQSQQEALQIAKKTLTEYVFSGMIPKVVVQNKELNIPLGAFVTLTQNGKLRGCIGTFELGEPLYKVIQDMTVSACSRDPRFLPISKNEIPEVKIEISVMTPKKKIKSWKDIEIGKHGVVVKRGNNAGTFLPQVALETGWDLEMFLGNLCEHKAGLEKECYKDPETELFVFECQIIK